jgi:hypothetical protein
MSRPLPTHLFITSNGDLFDTRVANWSKFPPLRKQYRYTHAEIDTVHELKATLRSGNYTDLGCYPLYLLTDDNDTMSFDGAIANLRQIIQSVATKANDGWRIVSCDINYEDSDMICCATNQPIECAYAPDDSDGDAIEDSDQ